MQANCYLIHDESSGAGVVVDPGGDSAAIGRMAAEAGSRVDGILITHGHADHLGATAELAAATGAGICGSGEVAMVLGDPDRYELFPGMPKVTPAAVGRLLEGDTTFTAGGIEVLAVATPGHSPGSITYHIAGGLFCGDLLFHGSVGRTDLPGGSFEQLAASVKKLMLMFPPRTPVYPGHGNATTLVQEKENNPFLTDLDW
ncbi:MAG: MBL fold metallo-hydrolase [Thermoleophilia bacterium]